ncbi:rna-directed rna polymerase 2 [Stemphylium lycopersici]|uniref:Translationally-controlled tumor protein homolog n=1 Tax=Stemphylium lycopersici TaxID=183478 RepID=A0A364NBU2_STELY|nr:rna-directed rna polymerase 2 [Stemphylium lycopersici]
MIIYKDSITGDEIISDSYNLKEIDGVVYEADCSKITVGGESFDTGANASAEEQEEGADDQQETKIDVVYSFRLNETGFDKKGYLSYLKGYMKSIKESLKSKGADEATIKDFETKAGGYAKKIIANFKDYEFFTGESMNPDGMIVLLNYREDGVTPYVTIWKHGLDEMKVISAKPLPRMPAAHGRAKGPVAPAAVPSPATPHRLRPGTRIDDLIRRLEADWSLGLKLRGVYSPSKPRDTFEKIYDNVKLLFFRNQPALNDAVAKFELRAPSRKHEERLGLLHELLSDAANIDKSVSKTITPSIGQGKSLTSSFREASKPANPSPLNRRNERESCESYTTAIDAGSPTDEDTGDEMNKYFEARSPSPSPSSRSANTLLKASNNVSLHMTRKRASENPDNSGNPSKLTKVLKGKQSVKAVTSSENTKLQFKKPTLEMAPSFHTDPYETSPTNTPFNDTTFSSQQTVDTTKTSFTSYSAGADACGEGLPRPKLARTSYATIGSLDDYDLIGAGTHSRISCSNYGVFEQDIQRDLNENFSQESSGRSRSTFGSVDEDDLLHKSFEVENEENQLAKKPPFVSKDRRQLDTPVATSISLSSTTKPHVQAGSATQSPSKMTHDIRNIPFQNLFSPTLPDSLKNIPYPVLFACQRVALESDVALEKIALSAATRSLPANSEAFWDSIDGYLRKANKPTVRMRDTNRFWQAEKQHFDGFTFKGKIVLSPKQTGPIMCLNSLAIQADRSCRLERMFGSDRFLYLDFPKFEASKSIRQNMAEMQQIQTQFQEWLQGEHSFLGRKWRPFHIENLKRSKISRRGEGEHDKRIVLFATEGLCMEHPYTVGQMLNKFLPLDTNQHQGFCKASARIELGLSRTIPALLFEREQIDRVDDKRATTDVENTEFNDSALYWQPIPNGTVMDDGCCIISVGAALSIWKAYKEATGVTGPLPSAFQGRIGGAKGLWMISAESYTKDPYHLKPWIKINDSQWKFDPPSCQPHHHRTFEVSNYSSAPSRSELHIAFIPILVDRGVPKSIIASLIHQCLESERKKLLDLLSDPVKVHEWVHRNGTKTATGIEMGWQAGLPVSLEEKIQFLIESGFHPLKDAFLAKSLEHFIQMKQIYQEAKLRIPLAKSTFLYGIADPVGVLRPGEIHVQFSTSFVDETTDEKYLCLRDMEALVARQPACRRSDIQRVRTVVHPALSHLVDVAVFPSRGRYPLAGKLQGGDYDGDLFWICWESALVQPFSNAPAPVQPTEPSQYHIETRTEKVRDLVDPANPENVDNFLRRAFEFRSNPSLLGLVTTFTDKQAYHENCIYSELLEQLYDRHDLLVDASKQGYFYPREEFDRFVRSLGKPPAKPAYKEAMEDCKKAKGSVAIKNCRMRRYRYNRNNTLDYLYFDVVRAHNIETMRQVKSALSQATEVDDTLRYPIERLPKKSSEMIKQEMVSLVKKLDKLHHTWGAGWNSKQKTTELPNALIEACYKQYLAIQPDHPDDPNIKPWVEPYLRPGACLWDTIKASALYSKFAKTEKYNFVFTMAGSELAKLKANSFDKTRSIVLPLRANLKPKPIKALVQHDDNDDDDDDEDEVDFECALEDPLLD